jgi:hypothetical protein
MSRLDQTWIEEHNARVLAWWAKHQPILDSLDDMALEEIVRWLHKGDLLTVNEIGHRLRVYYNGQWEPEMDMVIGRAAVHKALKKLDVPDADFNPKDRPMPNADNNQE